MRIYPLARRYYELWKRSEVKYNKVRLLCGFVGVCLSMSILLIYPTPLPHKTPVTPSISLPSIHTLTCHAMPPHLTPPRTITLYSTSSPFLSFPVFHPAILYQTSPTSDISLLHRQETLKSSIPFHHPIPQERFPACTWCRCHPMASRAYLLSSSFSRKRTLTNFISTSLCW